MGLHHQRIKIFGTSPEMIDSAENRYKFSRMLDLLEVDQPEWKELTSMEEASKFCEKVGFPVLVRPSYVLSGAAMNVVNSSDDLAVYLSQAVSISPGIFSFLILPFVLLFVYQIPTFFVSCCVLLCFFQTKKSTLW